MTSLTTTGASLHLQLATLPEAARSEVDFWRGHLEPLLGMKRGVVESLQALATRLDLPFGTVKNKFYALREQGVIGLVDRRLAGPAWWQTRSNGVAVSQADKELVKTYCERYQRSSEAALHQLRRDWRAGKVHTDTPVDPRTRMPRGWSIRNLQRWVPSEFELKSVRIGRGAAAAHRPLVYTSRADLYVGQFLLWDDMWHDHEVVDLDQRRRGRPLEFHGLDLASACKVAWGNRTRVERPDGTHEGLKAGDFRFLVASFYAAHGFHPDGTTNVLEHGTATFPEAVERVLYDATGGAIRVARGGMEGAAAHAGQYAGRSRGNFKFKAALESLGNLIHNEMAALPGQTGKDRQHAPEQQWGLQRHTDALLAAITQLDPERVEMLQWPLLTIVQFRRIADEIYLRINQRTEHNLEGWDDRWIPDAATGKMRRKSPWEVWTPGRRMLRPLPEAALALLIGHEHGTERTTRHGMFELRDGEISGDPLRYDATSLPDREKFLTVTNPFDASRLWVYDARGAFVCAAPRIGSVSRADLDAVHREMGRAAKQEAALLAPLRQRHLAEAREKAARHAHNAAVLRGGPVTAEEKAAARETARRIAREPGSLADFLPDLEPEPEPAAVPAEDCSDSIDDLLGGDLPPPPED